jgi:hypothetical protein
MRSCTLVMLVLAASSGCRDNAAPAGVDRDSAEAVIDRAIAARATSDQLAKQVAEAEHIAKQAAQEASEAQASVDRLAQALASLDERITAAVNAVLAAHSDVERNAARASLEQARRDKLELDSVSRRRGSPRRRPSAPGVFT